MPGTPKVAVITRTRNRPALLRRAIESVLAQSMPDWLHVVVNDGGDAQALDSLCKEYEPAYSGRLRILHETHIGMQQAGNTAIRQSGSTYIAIHDDDDSWHPDFLTETTAFLDAAGPDSVYQGVITRTLRILETELPNGNFREIERKPYVPLGEISLFRIGYENPFPPIAFLYRRAVHDAIGLFDPGWDMVADLDFNFRFLQRHDIGVVDKALAHYHWRDTTASPDNTNTVTAQQQRHATLLNELKNHYMRRAESAREVAHALSFHLSAYLVENQWMTAEIRERSIAAAGRLDAILRQLDAVLAAAAPVAELRERVAALQAAGAQGLAAQQSLVEQLHQLRAFNDTELWPKLTDDILPRLDAILHSAAQVGELRKELAALQPLGRQLERLQAFNDKELWPKLTGDILPRLDAILASAAQAAELGGRLEAQSAASGDQVLLLNQQVGQLRAFNDKELWPKLSQEIVPRLHSLLHFAAQIEQLRAFNDKELWPKLAAGAEGLQHLTGAVAGVDRSIADAAGRQAALAAGIEASHTAQTAALQALRDEIALLREENRRQWQLGRLRIRWLPGNDPSRRLS